MKDKVAGNLPLKFLTSPLDLIFYNQIVQLPMHLVLNMCNKIWPTPSPAYQVERFFAFFSVILQKTVSILHALTKKKET